MNTLKTIGFVGLGRMGYPMATRLLDAGFALQVIAHRNRRPVDELVARGAVEAATHARMAAVCDAVILCVSNADAVEAVTNEMRATLRSGTVIIDTSTSQPALTRRLARELKDVGVLFCDAPLTGGPEQAAQGKLGVLLGCPEDSVDTLQPVLAAFAERIERFGPPGSGHVAKLVNNYLVCGMIALIADTYNVARERNIDWAQLYSVMQCGSNFSPALQKIVEPALDGDFDGYGFSLANARKDMDYYVQLAGENAGPSGLAASVLAVFEEAVENGRGSDMVSRLIEPPLRKD